MLVLNRKIGERIVIGDDIIITTVSGAKLSPVYARFAVSDFFKSEMSEYDSRYVFVPLAYVRLSESAISVPQTNVSETEIRNGAAFVAAPSIAMLA